MNDGWLTFIDDERGRLCAEVSGGHVYFHLRIERRGISMVRDVKRMIPVLADYLKLKGFGVVRTFGHAGDVKLMRFIAMFDFHEIARGGVWVLFEREIRDA